MSDGPDLHAMDTSGTLSKSLKASPISPPAPPFLLERRTQEEVDWTDRIKTALRRIARTPGHTPRQLLETIHAQIDGSGQRGSRYVPRPRTVLERAYLHLYDSLFQEPPEQFGQPKRYDYFRIRDGFLRGEGYDPDISKAQIPKFPQDQLRNAVKLLDHELRELLFPIGSLLRSEGNKRLYLTIGGDITKEQRKQERLRARRRQASEIGANVRHRGIPIQERYRNLASQDGRVYAFEAELRLGSEHVFHRGTELKTIQHFIEGPIPGYFGITGSAGTGKTTLISQAINEFPHPADQCYFFTWHTKRTLSTGECLSHLYRALTAKPGSSRHDSHPSEVSIGLLMERIGEISKDGSVSRIVIYLDGIDENEPGPGYSSKIVDLLPKPSELAHSFPKVRFVLSARSQEAFNGLTNSDLFLDNCDNSDLATQIWGNTIATNVKDTTLGPKLEILRDPAIQRTMPNLLFLERLALDLILRIGGGEAIGPGDMPLNQEDFFRDYWQRGIVGREKDRDTIRTILRAIALLQEPLSVSDILVLLGIEDDEGQLRWDICRNLDQRTYRSTETCVLFHGSFKDFILRPEVTSEGTVTALHGRIADSLDALSSAPNSCLRIRDYFLRHRFHHHYWGGHPEKVLKAFTKPFFDHYMSRYGKDESLLRALYYALAASIRARDPRRVIDLYLALAFHFFSIPHFPSFLAAETQTLVDYLGIASDPEYAPLFLSAAYTAHLRNESDLARLHLTKCLESGGLTKPIPGSSVLLSRLLAMLYPDHTQKIDALASPLKSLDPKCFILFVVAVIQQQERNHHHCLDLLLDCVPVLQRLRMELLAEDHSLMHSLRQLGEILGKITDTPIRDRVLTEIRESLTTGMIPFTVLQPLLEGIHLVANQPMAAIPLISSVPPSQLLQNLNRHLLATIVAAVNPHTQSSVLDAISATPNHLKEMFAEALALAVEMGDHHSECSLCMKWSHHILEQSPTHSASLGYIRLLYKTEPSRAREEIESILRLGVISAKDLAVLCSFALAPSSTLKKHIRLTGLSPSSLPFNPFEILKDAEMRDDPLFVTFLRDFINHFSTGVNRYKLADLHFDLGNIKEARNAAEQVVTYYTSKLLHLPMAYRATYIPEFGGLDLDEFMLTQCVKWTRIGLLDKLPPRSWMTLVKKLSRISSQPHILASYADLLAQRGLPKFAAVLIDQTLAIARKKRDPFLLFNILSSVRFAHSLIRDYTTALLDSYDRISNHPQYKDTTSLIQMRGRLISVLLTLDGTQAKDVLRKTPDLFFFKHSHTLIHGMFEPIREWPTSDLKKIISGVTNILSELPPGSGFNRFQGDLLRSLEDALRLINDDTFCCRITRQILTSIGNAGSQNHFFTDPRHHLLPLLDSTQISDSSLSVYSFVPDRSNQFCQGILSLLLKMLTETPGQFSVDIPLFDLSIQINQKHTHFPINFEILEYLVCCKRYEDVRRALDLLLTHFETRSITELNILFRLADLLLPIAEEPSLSPYLKRILTMAGAVDQTRPFILSLQAYIEKHRRFDITDWIRGLRIRSLGKDSFIELMQGLLKSLRNDQKIQLEILRTILRELNGSVSGNEGTRRMLDLIYEIEASLRSKEGTVEIKTVCRSLVNLLDRTFFKQKDWLRIRFYILLDTLLCKERLPENEQQALKAFVEQELPQSLTNPLQLIEIYRKCFGKVDNLMHEWLADTVFSSLYSAYLRALAGGSDTNNAVGEFKKQLYYVIDDVMVASRGWKRKEQLESTISKPLKRFEIIKKLEAGTNLESRERLEIESIPQDASCLREIIEELHELFRLSRDNQEAKRIIEKGGITIGRLVLNEPETEIRDHFIGVMLEGPIDLVSLEMVEAFLEKVKTEYLRDKLRVRHAILSATINQYPDVSILRDIKNVDLRSEYINFLMEEYKEELKVSDYLLISQQATKNPQILAQIIGNALKQATDEKVFIGALRSIAGAEYLDREPDVATSRREHWHLDKD